MEAKHLCKKHKVERLSYSGICPECRKGKALKAVMDYCGPDIETNGLDTAIYDLVADLLHLAKENGIEPDYLIRMAQMHFDSEVEDEAEEAEAMTQLEGEG